MAFKAGDRVVTKTDDIQYSGLKGLVVEPKSYDADSDYRVLIDNFDGADNPIVYGEHELELLPEWVEALQYEESHPASEDFGISVQEVVNEVRDTLIAKNKAYGNSALEPVRVFSTADPVEQLRVRIDDKLSRLKSSLNNDNEDTVLDLMGYLVLLRIATRKQDSE